MARISIVLWLSATCLASMASPLHLTMQQAVRMGLKHNLSLKQARSQWSVQQDAYRVTKNRYAPQVQLDGSGVSESHASPSGTITPRVQWRWPIGTDMSVTTDTKTHVSGWHMNQPLWRGFGLKAHPDWLSAADQLQVSDLALRSQKNQIIRQILSSFWTLMQAKQSLKVEKKAVDQAKKVYDNYQLQFKLGRIPYANVTQQRTQWLQTKLQVLAQKNTLIQAQQALLLRLNLPVTTSLYLSEDLSLFAHIHPPALHEAITKALRYNLGFRQQNIRQRITTRQEDQADNAQRWQLDWSADINDHGEKKSQLTFSIPFNDESRRQQWRTAHANVRQGAWALASAKQDLVSQVTQTWHQCRMQSQRIDLMRQKQRLSRKNVANTIRRQALGRSSAYEVTQQQQILTQDALSLIQLNVSYLQSIIDLYILMGSLSDVFPT